MTDIAFFTTGDLATETIPDGNHHDQHPSISIALESGTTLTNDVPRTSQLWEARAMALATRGHVHGVRTTAEARRVLDELPRGSVRDVFFIGHGFPAGYAFSGRRTGPHGTSGPFVSEPGNTLQAPSADIADENGPLFVSLARALSRNEHVHIVFMSCFTGAETRPERQGDEVVEVEIPAAERLGVALAAKLQREGFRQFTVGCYVDFYAVRPEVSNATHRIEHFLDRIVRAGTATPIAGHDSPGDDRLPRLQKIYGQIPSTRLWPN